MTDDAALGGAPGPEGSRRAEGLATWLRNPALLCLGAAVVASGAVLILLGSHLVFIGDDWNIVLYRRGISTGTFLDPYNHHLVAGLVAIYKVLLATFGLDSPAPFHVTATLIYLLAAVMLFAYVRRRAGDWPAFLATVVILFFGAAAVDLLSPFQMFFSGSIAAGIGALLALDREDSGGDVLACVLLLVAIAFSEIGVAFSVGALVRTALSRRPLAGRLCVALVPLLMYAVWWLGWGHRESSNVSFHNVATAPEYVFHAIAAAIGALVGLTSSSDQLPDPVGQQWGPILFIVAVALAGWRVRHLGGVPRGVWPVLAVGLTFWVLAAFNEIPERAPDNSRYLYPSAVLVLLLASEVLNGVRPRVRVVAVAAAVAATAVAANLAFLSDSYRLFWKGGSQTSKAELRALEIAGALQPSYVLRLGFVDLNAGAYLSAVDAWGSPAYSSPELAAAPEGPRVDADRTLAAILGLRLQRSSPARGPCQTVPASASGTGGHELRVGRVEIKTSAAAPVQARLARFADAPSVDLGALPRGTWVSLRITPDRADRPWRIGFAGNGPVKVCGATAR